MPPTLSKDMVIESVDNSPEMKRILMVNSLDVEGQIGSPGVVPVIEAWDVILLD